MKIDRIALNNSTRIVTNTGCERNKQFNQNFKAAMPNSNSSLDKFLNSKYTKKVFKFANINPFGFTIANLMITCMVMRPITTLMIPGSSKDDKQYLAAKSVISSSIANGFRLALCLPLAKSIEKLGKKAAQSPKTTPFPAEGTKKFDALNFAINNGFAVVLGFFTSALMVYAVGSIMNKVEAHKAKNKNKEVVANGN